MLFLIIGRPIVSVLAQKYGKRPQFLFASTMGVIGTIICIAGRSDYNTLMAGRVIQGFGATAFESLSLATVGDIFYLHDRGWRTALIVLTLACMASLVSIIAGVITENIGYKYLFIILLPFNVVGFFGVIFFLPESQFDRTASDISACLGDTKIETESHHQEVSNDTSHGERHKDRSERQSIQQYGPKKTYVQSLAPFSSTYTNKNILLMMLEIFMHLLNPAVIWILLTSAVIVVSDSMRSFE